MDDLMRKWLWMKAMEYAVETIMDEFRWRLYPRDKYHEWKHEGYRNIERNIFEHALANWSSPDFRGSYVGGSRLSIGLDLQCSGGEVKAKYRDLEVKIKWTAVKSFIRKALDYEPEDTQITMFELLAQEAMNE